MTNRVVVLINFIPPYMIPVFKTLHEHFGEMRMLISTPMEPNRPWSAEWRGLPVEVQRTLTFRVTWKHPQGFTEPLFIHVPVDTLWRLWRYRPDVVIAGEMGMRTVQAAIYRYLRPSSRLIISTALSEHTEKGRGRVREVLRRWLSHRADALTVKGESGARYIRRFGVADHRIFRVPPTTDVFRFEAVRTTRRSREVRRLLYVGQLIERKGVLPFVKALLGWATENADRELELWFVGDGSLRPILESMQNSSVSFRFFGNVPYEQLPEIYARVDVLAFPTLADEWGMVVNEAMAAGVPVLGSLYSQAVEELVEDGVNGWSFYPDRPAELSSALDRALLVTPDVLQGFKEAATSKVLDLLTPEKVVDRYVEAISFVSSNSFDA